MHRPLDATIPLPRISPTSILTQVEKMDVQGKSLRLEINRGAWVAQSVKLPTLGFSSGHDLMVCEANVSPTWGSALTV